MKEGVSWNRFEFFYDEIIGEDKTFGHLVAIRKEMTYGAPLHVDTRKNSIVNEGELLNGESQLNFLSFGVASSIRFSGLVVDNNVVLYI